MQVVNISQREQYAECLIIREIHLICKIQCTEYFSFLNCYIKFCKTVKSKQIYDRDLGRDH